MNIPRIPPSTLIEAPQYMLAIEYPALSVRQYSFAISMVNSSLNVSNMFAVATRASTVDSIPFLAGTLAPGLTYEMPFTGRFSLGVESNKYMSVPQEGPSCLLLAFLALIL